MTTSVCFTMDNLSDAADLGRGRIERPREPGSRPALEQGFPDMLAIYKRFGIKITHFIEGWNGSVHPEEIQFLLDQGHQLGMHGWQHEKWAELDEDIAYALAERSTLALEKVSGVRPVAFRAPGGGRGEATARILNKLGYRIDASLGLEGVDGGPVSQLGEELWTVPYKWVNVDATHWLWEQLSPEQTELIWMNSLAKAAESGSPVTFIWHPHIMGIDPERRAVGERILAYVCDSEEFSPVTLEELIEHTKGDKRTLENC